MPVSSEVSISGPFTPNGVTTAFPFGFKATAANEVVAVDQNGALISTALYTVTLDADEGGTLTFAVAPQASSYSTIYVVSDPALTQPSDFDNAGPSFNPAALTRALDRAAARDLKQQREIDRAIKLPFGGGVIGKFPVVLPDGSVGWSSGTGADGGLRADLAAEGFSFIGDGSASLSDIIRVNAARYGFLPSRSAAQNAAAFADIIGDVGGGTHPVIVDIPPAVYESDIVGIEAANIWIDAHGSTFTEGGRLATSPAATGFKLKNARFYLDTADAILTLNGSHSAYESIELVKFGSGSGYMAMIEGVTGSSFTNWKLRGGNGIFAEGEALMFANIHGIGRTVGGDDFIVLKARNRRTGDIVINGVYAENYSNALAIGSEVGTLGVNSAARAGRVENVRAEGVVARNCTSAVFIKPGAIDAGPAYDWRDGLVRKVYVAYNLADPEGSKYERGCVITASRGALVDDITINDQQVVRARFGPGAVGYAGQRLGGVDIYIPDYSAATPPAAAPTIRGLKLECDIRDSYDGAASGGSVPGYPLTHMIRVEKQNAAHGAIEDVTIRLKGRGCAEAGVLVGVGLESAVNIEQAHIDRASQQATGSLGGVRSLSKIRIAPASTIITNLPNGYPIGDTALGNIAYEGVEVESVRIGTVAAGTGKEFVIWRTPANLYICNVYFVDGAGIVQSATNKTTLELLNMATGSAFASGDSNTFNFSQHAPVQPNFLNSIGSAQALAIPANTAIRFKKTDVGTGQTVTDMSVIIHYIRHGR